MSQRFTYSEYHPPNNTATTMSRAEQFTSSDSNIWNSAPERRFLETSATYFDPVESSLSLSLSLEPKPQFKKMKTNPNREVSEKS